MNKLFIGCLMVASTVLTACNSLPSHSDEKPIGMANPASEYCIKQGGTLIPQKHKDGGEYALCKLPNGQTIEEWDFYRNSFEK